MGCFSKGPQILIVLAVVTAALADYALQERLRRNQDEYFRTWVIASGGFVAKEISIDHAPGSGRFIKTREAVKADQLLWRIPAHMVLSQVTASVRARHLSASLPRDLKLPFVIMYENFAQGRSSKWFPYFSVMPKTTPPSVLLQGLPELSRWSIVQSRLLSASRNAAYLIAFWRAFVKSWQLPALGPNEAHWALFVFSSRSHMAGRCPEMNTTSVLYPGPCLHNHRDGPRSMVRMFAWRKCGVEVRTNEAFQPGLDLLFDYHRYHHNRSQPGVYATCEEWILDWLHALGFTGEILHGKGKHRYFRNRTYPRDSYNNA